MERENGKRREEREEEMERVERVPGKGSSCCV